jgi:hypothetical protein
LFEQFSNCMGSFTSTRSGALKQAKGVFLQPKAKSDMQINVSIESLLFILKFYKTKLLKIIFRQK